MYEKKINVFNDVDREIYNSTFKYNCVFFIILLIIIFTLILWKKDHYYENSISFTTSKNALIIVDKDYLNIINNKSKILLNNIEIKYNIDKIEEKEKYCILNIHFDNEINIKTPVYKILLEKESLLKYIIRVIKGD